MENTIKNTDTLTKKRVHFVHQSLLNTTNPIKVHLIGAGGTGSQVITALGRMHHALQQLGHAGFCVTLWDNDTITQANLGRQLFAECELGLYKSTALISRINRFFGTNWNAQPMLFSQKNLANFSQAMQGELYLLCVDTAKARLEIAQILSQLGGTTHYHNRPKYGLDFGNSRHTGQVILFSIGEHFQPQSDEYTCVGNLPMPTEEFADLFENADLDTETPSCSLAEALHKQDLFINATLSQMGASLLWNLFRNGLTDKRGFFLNLQDFRSQPMLV